MTASTASAGPIHVVNTASYMARVPLVIRPSSGVSRSPPLGDQVVRPVDAADGELGDVELLVAEPGIGGARRVEDRGTGAAEVVVVPNEAARSRPLDKRCPISPWLPRGGSREPTRPVPGRSGSGDSLQSKGCAIAGEPISTEPPTIATTTRKAAGRPCRGAPLAARRRRLRAAQRAAASTRTAGNHPDGSARSPGFTAGSPCRRAGRTSPRRHRTAPAGPPPLRRRRRAGRAPRRPGARR